ncbi:MULTISPECIES: HVO_A0556 family zinc finger protein [Halorussus]|uniref:HVO_A0556 family zinc finger protein n=1 Tax=Halorussus aquaticus TaxID=2953748 RepID=A0ABD5Q5N4_9EURY|nr:MULTISPECIES: HVO_A0556 family zinc finger protein [Halorussus]
MQHVASEDAAEPLLVTLAGDDCRWCASGTLAREQFKGDDAVVCEDCGTPAARVW